MPRRVSLPGAAELFRTTPAEGRAGQQDEDSAPVNQRRVDEPSGQQEPVAEIVPDPAPEQPASEVTAHSPAAAAARSPITPDQQSDPGQKSGRRAGTGRVRHDEKITVYVSNDELLDLERARLSLRAEHRMAVDRGRIVRAALALALGDLAEHGGDSELVRRLSQP